VHHLDTYGPVSNPALGLGSPCTKLTDLGRIVYDDFIANFTASKWNASAWLDLFDEAGAKYFVIVTVRCSTLNTGI
jgi:alpha-L-fucosidase